MGADEVDLTEPFVGVSAKEFEFFAKLGRDNPEPQILSISNTGPGTMTWEVKEDCHWLQVTPTSGESSGQVNEVTLSVHISGLEVASYRCELTVWSGDAINSPQRVVVFLHIVDSGTLLVPSEYPTIQQAIDAAADGNTVAVGNGAYRGGGNRNIDCGGKTIVLEGLGGPQNCVIDCEGTSANPARAFYFHSGEDANTVVRGFTLKSGFVSAGGGGIYCSGSSPTIENCAVINNTVASNDCSDTYGGGIYCTFGSNPTIINCTISNNKVLGGYGLDFGMDGRDAYGGGAYCSADSHATLKNCTIADNTSSGGSAFSGGIFPPYPQEGDAYGGGIYGGVTIINCLIIGNTAAGGSDENALGGSGYGAGVYCTSSSDITNCTVAGNSAVGGAGILPGTSQGGGISGTGTTTITDCILWGNMADTGPQVYGAGSVTYSDVQGGWAGAGNIDSDPLFANAASGDWRLLANSPCIDTGSNDALPPSALVDLDGNPRIINDTVDMGACEFQGVIYVDDDAPRDPGPADPAVSDPLENGTQDHPFDTIQEGIDMAQSGHRVLANAGEYREELDFLGKSITVKSSDEPAVLTGAEYYAVSFYHGEDSNSILENFIVKDSDTAFLFAAASPTLSNVTVVDCDAGAVADGGADPDIRNSIFWDNTCGDLFGCEARYSCIQHSTGGEGNISSDPLFADANGGDYHLLSEYGRYSSGHGVWMLDAVTSPCIDGGDPNDDYDYEPLPNGSRINMGAYGGTSFAGMSEWAIADDIYPSNYGQNMCGDMTIDWPRDEFVVYHRVYFGTGLNDVNAGATAVETDWEPNSWSPGGLELGTTYYWRIEGVNDTNIHSPWPGFVRRFTTNDGNAFDPYPADNQIVVPLDARLRWSLGCLADSHDVYFSTDFNDVNDRSPGAFQGNQVETMFDPCGLDYYTWYYWRVDEVNDGNAWPGKVWSFRTHDVFLDPNRVLGYRFDETDGNIAHDSSGYERHGFVAGPGGEPYWRPTSGFIGGCLAFLNDTAVTVPTDTLSGINDGITIAVWLKDADPEGGDNWVFDTGAGEYRVQAKVATETEPNVFWRAGNDANDVLTWDLNDIEPAALQDWNLWVFVKDENAGTMGVYLNALSPFRGFGNACGGASNAGVDKTLLNIRDKTFKIGALTSQDHDFTGKMDDFIVYDYAFPQCWFGCTLPIECAWRPRPSSGQQDVPPDVVLKWLPGDYALSHDVYLGADWDAVNDADTASSEYKGRYGPNEYDPGYLELDETYYWRIDEVNEPNIWKCLVWEFTTANFLVVDDMESYDAVPAGGNQIWDTWDDGFVNYTGAQVVLEYGSGAIIHSGDQSMMFGYDNFIGFYKYSEIDANTAGPRPGNLKIGKDWTAQGVKALTLFFYGRPDNDATQPMYVVLEDGSYDFVMVKYGDHGEDPNDIRQAEWHEWNIPLSEFADGGVELADVSKVRIGFGDRMNPVAGGSGIVYFDDIRLYPPKCVTGIGPDGDLNSDCMVDYRDLEIIAEQWLCSGDCTHQLYPDDKVDFKDYVVLAENWLADTRWP
jgi:parallel beta-helix repeat protein